MTSAGYAAQPAHPSSLLAEADTIVVPGINGPIVETGVLPEALRRLAATARPDARWVSICTGAFVLAGLGLLRGRVATTHWCHVDAFTRHFPDVPLNPDVLYVDHGDVLTSAGNAAGIDLLLHIVRSDLGAEAANRVARGAVVAPWRAGGQAQFIDRPIPEETDAGTGPARIWALEHLAEPIGLADLAGQCGMSVRTFTQALPRGDGRDRRRVARPGPRRPRTASARVHRPVRGPDRRRVGLRDGCVAAPAPLGLGRTLAARLPPDLPRRGRLRLTSARASRGRAGFLTARGMHHARNGLARAEFVTPRVVTRSTPPAGRTPRRCPALACPGSSSAPHGRAAARRSSARPRPGSPSTSIRVWGSTGWG